MWAVHDIWLPILYLHTTLQEPLRRTPSPEPTHMSHQRKRYVPLKSISRSQRRFAFMYPGPIQRPPCDYWWLVGSEGMGHWGLQQGVLQAMPYGSIPQLPTLSPELYLAASIFHSSSILSFNHDIYIHLYLYSYISFHSLPFPRSLLITRKCGAH